MLYFPVEVCSPRPPGKIHNVLRKESSHSFENIQPGEESMKRFVEFPLEDGGTILVEVDEPESVRGTARVARDTKTIEKAKQTFESALDKIKPTANAVISKLRDLHDSPDEVTVEFGLKLNGEAGVVFAAASVEANYKVTLTWKKHTETKP
jgi:hypothetical protein